MAEFIAKNGHVNKPKGMWMPFDCHAYLDDTAHLTTLEHGAYMLLIMHYWTTGKAIPLSKNLSKISEKFEKILQNISRVSAYQAAKISPTIIQFFAIEDGMLKHRRIDQEISESNARRQSAAERGKAGGEAKRDGKNVATARNAHPSPALANKYPYPLPVQDSSLRDSTVIENGVTPDGCTIVHGVNFGRLS